MHLRVAGHSDAKEVAVVLLNEFDKVDGIIKAVLVVDPVGSSPRRVTSESQDVAQAELLSFIQRLNDFLSGHEGTRHMHHDIHTRIFLDVSAEVKGDVGSDSASVPGNVDTERVGLAHALDTVKEVLNTLVCLGREVLERVITLLFTFGARKRALDFFLKFHIMMSVCGSCVSII